MNTNDEDLDLGLSLSSTCYLVETRLNNNNSGAGVNADPRVDMSFAASNPLSELVWSPHDGLRLKCTESSLVNKRPLLLWNVGPSNTTRSIRSRGIGDDKVVNEEMLISVDDKPSLVGSFRSTPSHDIESNDKMEEVADTENDVRKDDNEDEVLGRLRNVESADIAESSRKIAEESNDKMEEVPDTINDVRKDDNEDEVLGSLRNVESADIAETSRKIVEEDHRIETSASTSDVMGPTVVAVHSEPHPTKLSDSPPLMKLEFSAENNLARPTNSGIHLNREKGKEKVLSDGDMYGRSSNEEDSHESVESCNSVGLFSKGVKRDSYDHQETQSESKRTKMQIQSSRSNCKHDSSFMNWISNMVKCLSDSNKEGPSSPSPALPIARSDEACRKSQPGNFETVFRSLYCQKTPKISAFGVEKGKYSIQEADELMVDDKKLIENIPRSDDKEINLNTNTNTSIISQPSNHSTSLWITRYCTKTASPENRNPSSYYGGESSRTRFSKSNKSLKGTDFYLENDLEKNQEFVPRTIVTAESTVAPVRMFHAIRKLRLSRADILRWMNSDIPLPRINGFFLRLRIGKLEAGLGGTGYYIARITGDTKENVGCKSRNSILVDVGGIKSFIGSQYVSNHDFLEDEMNAWWCRAVKNGGKIPSLDELIIKSEDRKCLGF